MRSQLLTPVLTIATSIFKQAGVQKLYTMCHNIQQHTHLQWFNYSKNTQGNHTDFDQGTSLSTRNITHVCACITFLVATSITRDELQCQCTPHHQETKRVKCIELGMIQRAHVTVPRSALFCRICRRLAPRCLACHLNPFKRGVHLAASPAGSLAANSS